MAFRSRPLFGAFTVLALLSSKALTGALYCNYPKFVLLDDSVAMKTQDVDKAYGDRLYAFGLGIAPGTVLSCTIEAIPPYLFMSGEISVTPPKSDIRAVTVTLSANDFRDPKYRDSYVSPWQVSLTSLSSDDGQSLLETAKSLAQQLAERFTIDYRKANQK
jgi:hypothetical protein